MNTVQSADETDMARAHNWTSMDFHGDSEVPDALRKRGFTVSAGEGNIIKNELDQIAYFISW